MYCKLSLWDLSEYFVFDNPFVPDQPGFSIVSTYPETAGPGTHESANEEALINLEMGTKLS